MNHLNPSNPYRYRLWPAIFNAEGFTLLEIMIALAIIGMTVTVILHTVNYHSGIMYENTIKTGMFQSAKEKMVELEMETVSSKGVIGASGLRYEKTVSRTEDPEIIELKAVVTGHGNKVTLSELVRKKNWEAAPEL